MYLIVIILVLIFLSSGIGKLIEPESAVTTLGMAFPAGAGQVGISTEVAKLLVLLLSNAEIALAVLLIFKRFRAVAMKFVLGMLVGFLVFLVYIKTSGIITDDCGCFGGLIKRTVPEAIFDEIVLILMSVGYIINNRRDTKLLRNRI